MSEFILNGKKVSINTLKKYIDDEKNILTSLEITMNPPKSPEGIKIVPPLSHEGVQLDKEFLGSWSRQMEYQRAAYAAIKLTECRTLMGKNLWIIMFEPGSQSWWRRVLLNIFQRMLGSVPDKRAPRTVKDSNGEKTWMKQ